MRAKKKNKPRPHSSMNGLSYSWVFACIKNNPEGRAYGAPLPFNPVCARWRELRLRINNPHAFYISIDGGFTTNAALRHPQFTVHEGPSGFEVTP